MTLKVGDIISFKRTFNKRDVELFTEISGDEGIHHLTPDEQGKLVVQGLLIATLPTKVGGDHNVLAREMNKAEQRSGPLFYAEIRKKKKY